MYSKTHRILIVDDASYFRTLKGSYLKRRSCRMLQAKNGEEALYVISQERPDLIIMDLSMPTINGEECCRMLKGHDLFKDIPIVMVANSWDKEAERRSHEAGCDDFLFKPLDRRQFYAMVRRYLDISERRCRRISYEEKVIVRCGATECAGFILNISKDGLFVSSSKVFDEISEVELKFKLKGFEDAVLVTGWVVWTRKEALDIGAGPQSGMGIQFIDLSSEVEEAIMKMVEFKTELIIG